MLMQPMKNKYRHDSVLPSIIFISVGGGGGESQETKYCAIGRALWKEDKKTEKEQRTGIGKPPGNGERDFHLLCCSTKDHMLAVISNNSSDALPYKAYRSIKAIAQNEKLQPKSVSAVGPAR
jgi:hypothetical protein